MQDALAMAWRGGVAPGQEGGGVTHLGAAMGGCPGPAAGLVPTYMGRTFSYEAGAHGKRKAKAVDGRLA